MSTIEEIAIANYQTNMNFLKKINGPLFNRLSALEILLEDGRYPQKYELEYKDGYFDIMELASKSYLYNQNSEIFSEELTDKISFKKNDQVFESLLSFKFTESALKKLTDADALTKHATTAPIIDYHDSNVNKSMHMNKINKFIFLGMGLGLHLPKIIKKTGAKIILIVEDDIEIFRLSLFTCNYEEALKGCTPIFSISQNHSEFSETYNLFHPMAFADNLYLKFSLFSTEYEKKIREIQALLLSRPEVGYPHEHLLYKNSKVLNLLKKNYGFLDLSKKNKETFFADKPILILAAGPSLHANIEWLKTNSDKFIVMTVFAALKTLSKTGISPDIVVQIDENVGVTKALIDSFDSFDFLKNSIFIFSASVPDILFETFNKNKIYLMEDRTHYKLNNAQLNAPSVGEVTYAISLIFNAGTIYFLGLDLALSDDGSTHAKDHIGASTVDLSNTDELHDSASLSGTILQRKGNLRDIVNTTPLLAVSIHNVDHFTRSLKSSTQSIYNFSDGAYFENIEPQLIKNCTQKNQLDKNNLVSQLSMFFDKYSESKLTNEEFTQLQNREAQISSYYENLAIFEQSATSNRDLFIEKYQELIKSITSSSKTELKEIMLIHSFITSPYVIDLFNTKEFDNPKKHTKRMKKIIVTQIKKIMKFYEEELSKTIEELQHAK